MKKVLLPAAILLMSIALFFYVTGKQGEPEFNKVELKPPVFGSNVAPPPPAPGQTGKAEALVYTNSQYGFTFALPDSWQNYSIVNGQWEGRAIGGSQDGKITENGALISIRHPQWTAQKPRQDIPIMVFTLTQWDLIRQEKISVGAAPIGPKELARNSKYVFALPARYNYAFPSGYEEVEEILAAKALQAI